MIPNIKCSSYLELPDNFYQVINPTPIANPYLVAFNSELASYLNSGLDTEKETVELCAGNKVFEQFTSIALAYAGHQFGHYVPLLGDGRAVVLGELYSHDKQRWDMQLKGSGPTAFSRMGDGRAPLAAVLREYIISEAMYGFNIPTTRSLAVIGGSETIYRQTGPVPIGVLTRITSSSLRVGSFEYAANQKDTHLLKCLADYAIERHFPDLAQHDNPYFELVKAVVERQASLMAEWMGVGFIHGVMNTDNMAICGETLDYGPCAFMDEFDFNCVFSSIDMNRRYAYGNQASIAQWNLAQLSHTLLPLFAKGQQSDTQQVQEIIDLFTVRFQYYWSKKIHEKLGLLVTNEHTLELIERFFILLQQYKPDFTNTFLLMSRAIDSELYQNHLISALGNESKSKQWVSDWLACITQQNITVKKIRAQMNQVNPAYIPRNHLVEQAIQDFVEKNDRGLMDELLLVLKDPYRQQKNTEHLQSVPSADERVLQTFCGT